MGALTGKTALVTGGSRGIGRAVSERLAAAGAFVAVHYGHDETAANETLVAIQRAGGSAFAVRSVLGVDGAGPRNIPPLTSTNWPVIQRAWSEARNATTSATSAG